MGLPITLRLLAAGYEVLVFDPLPDPTRRAVAGGANSAGTAAELARLVEVVVTVLPGPCEVRDAMLGPGGAVEAMPAGSCWLDLTSNDPRVAAEVSASAEIRGISSVGAPMTGGPTDAAAGTLGFLIGGASEAVSRIMPVLEALGDSGRMPHLGAHIGSGYTAKLLANTLWFGQAIAVTEVLLLGQALDLDLVRLRDALEHGPGGSNFMTDDLDALLRGDYLTTFGIDRVVEELDTVTSLASVAGTPSDLTVLVARLHREALNRFGPIDGELLVAKLLEGRAGRTLRTPAH